ncbi:MAG: Rnase Y domain-containing protein, partial [Syntrophales bacterium]
MIDYLMMIITILTALAIGIVLGLVLRQRFSQKRLASFQTLSERIVEEAKKEAETIKKEAILQAKENLLRAKMDLEKEARDRKNEMDQLEWRLRTKEESLDKRIETLTQKETSWEGRERAFSNKENQLNEKHNKLDLLLSEQQQKLEKIAGISAEEAKAFLVQAIEVEAKREAAATIRKIEDETKRQADKKAGEILAYAIQRYAGDFVAESTISVVNLPNDEMKGRIIGREGRNIRAIEAATGIDLIVDDT